ncbi:MAG: TVP38/TMEM64 family protein [Deltaproteobacteria bacterium]|nr:TVP38/TMEM64 family protein [Deltaproteobacteria bacterium]
MIKLLILILVLAAGLYLFTWGPLKPYASPQSLLELLNSAREQWWLPPIFIAAYATSGLIAFPGSVATLVGGVLFGVLWGSLFNWIAANLSALLGFLAARYLGRNFAIKLARGRLARLDESVGRHGFRTILYLRLIPLFPFNAINIAAGLATIRWRDYLIATAIGILPGCVIYTYFASALISGSLKARHESYINLAIASGLLVALSLVPILVKHGRQKN